jgi:hypothetical protein
MKRLVIPVIETRPRHRVDPRIRSPQRGKWVGVLLAVAITATACGGGSSTSASSDQVTWPPSVGVAAGAMCPDSDPANKCLNKIDAGTYTTVQFEPALTYTVPDGGWSNPDDLPGEFMLLPPGSDIRGVDPGRSDYIGVYATAAAPRQDCSGRPDETVPTSAEDYVSWLQANPALEVSAPVPITVGSHEGTSVEVALRTGEGPCLDPTVGRFAEFAVGVPPADFSAGVTPTLDYRVDAFDVDQQLFLVLIGDPQGSGSNERHWPSTADQIVSEFSF